MTNIVRFVKRRHTKRRTILTTLSVIFTALIVIPAAAFLQTGSEDPHGGYDETTDSCLKCHDMHEAPDSPLIGTTTVKETCYQCHNGTGASTDIQAEFGESTIGTSTQASYHPLPHSLDGYSVKCGDCHTPHNLRTDYTKLLRLNDGSGGWIYSPTDTPIGNAYCYRCHGSASPFPSPFGDHTFFEGGVHQLLGGDPASGSEIQCLTCHGPHGSAYPGLSEQEATCLTCHNAATPNTNPDLPFDTTELEYAFTAAANDYDPTDADGLIRIYHHPIGDDEQDGGNRQVECASCHETHRVDRDYSDSGSKLSNPGDTRGEVLVTWDDATFTRGDISLFCVECHQSPAITAPFDAGIWIPYDIRLTDDSSVLDDKSEPHDSFDAAYYFTDDKSDHGQEASLACTACHDPHGSSNAFLLREYVISPGDAGVPAGSVSARVTRFNDEDTAEQQAILSSFCDGCHDDHHSPNQICTNCHYHGSGRF